MCPKKATRKINSKTQSLEDIITVNIEIPDFLQDWIHTEEGLKMCNKCKERKDLQDCSVDAEGESIQLVGLKANIEQATKFLKFNFDN